MILKPNQNEYPKFYQTYVSKLSEASILDLLEAGPGKLKSLLQNISEEKTKIGYAPGKWSVKQLVGHMMDTERIMAYRLLCFSRLESQSLPGFDENIYVDNSNFNKQSLGNLLSQYNLLRESNLVFIRNLDDEMLNRSGVANGNPVTVRALIAIIAGHELHHLDILRDRYLPVVSA